MATPKHRKKKMTSRTPDETIEQGQNVEMQAETNLVDLAMDKKPIEFASEFHERMLGRIKEMLDPYREQLAHDLMKNEVDEEVEEIDELSKNKLAGFLRGSQKQKPSKKRREGVNSAITGILGKDKFKSIFGKYQKEFITNSEQLDEKKSEYEKMVKERSHFFKKKAKGMTKPFDKNHGLDEAESLDELSKKTLTRYMNKASKSAADLAVGITKKGKKDSKTLNKFKNRVTGVHNAKSIVDDPDEPD